MKEENSLSMSVQSITGNRIVKKVLLVLLVCLMILILLGYLRYLSLMEKTFNLYRPMVYVDDTLYGDAGSSREALSGEWDCIGRIAQQVSNIEPMVEENYTANNLKVGTEIYVNDGSPDIIYLRIEEDKYILYEKLEE